MPKSGMQKYCSLLKPKISPQKESNERNAKESSITVNSFQLRRGNLFKSKKKNFQDFADVLRCTTACSNNSSF